jgi:fructokinase
MTRGIIADAARAPRILCWGELLWDLFPDGPRLGGAAANVAYHAAALGAHATLVSRVGDDELGASARHQLGQAGVDVSLVQVDRERPTGTVDVELCAGEPRFGIAQNAAWDRVEYDAAVAQAVQAAQALVYGTLAQRTPLGFGSLREALRDAPAHCLRLCDLNVRPPFATPEVVRASVTQADVVKLNQLEAGTLATLLQAPDPVMCLLEQCGVTMVALTRGERGCLLARLDQRHEHPGFAVADPTRGDRVGAGDAFAAVLAVDLVRGTDLARIPARANRYASHVASASGAMPPVPPALLRELLR